ncbi:MAG: hypothetical protein FJX75_08135 [Armatimonadetes bacterium]|nr:hypothetical protein [Armatimonadota bacterium]
MRELRAIGSVSVVAGLIAIVIAIAAYAAPLVDIQKPQDKQIISGTADIHVTYAADSASPIERVQVFIDGQLVKDYRLDKPNLQGSVAFRWDFTLATPSQHSISARAQDSSGAVGATGIKVEVRRNEGAQPTPAGGADRTPPTVDIYYPAEGQVVKGEIRVKADVSDNVGVRTVIFFLDGELKTMMVNSPNYSTRLDTTRMTEGAHMVRVAAYDPDDNEGSAERTFVVQNREATATQGTGDSRIATKSDGVLPPPPPIPGESSGIGGPAPDVRPPEVPRVQPGAGAEGARDTSAGGVRPDLVAKLPPEPAGPGSRLIVGRPEGGVSVPPPGAVVHRSTQTGTPGGESVAVLGRATDSGSSPRVTVPREGRLQPPPPIVKHVETVLPKPKPVASGPTTQLAMQTEVRLASAATPTERPVGLRPARPGALKPPPPPATRDMVAFAGITGETTARTVIPTDTAWRPKTTQILGRPAVILAEPVPQGAYASAPIGEPRQSRVAMLPPSSDEGAKSKIGIPDLQVQDMARFRDVKIVFDGKLIPLRAAPEVIDGISLTPLREVFEGCDGTLYWFHQEKRVHAVNPKVDMELSIGSDTAKVNGEARGLALAPYIKNGRTMVPLDFLALTLDVTVSFNSSTGELIISRNDF